MKYRLLAILLSMLSVINLTFAQSTGNYQELLNQTDKMIAVIIVLVIILLGIAVFLLFMEKRIRKLESKNKPN